MAESMRDVFAHHHRLSVAEQDKLFRTCLFALDASALLNIYRYANETREDLFRVLRHLSPRLWIPYQAAEEFYRNRLGVIREQRSLYAALSSTLDQALAKITDAGIRRSGFLPIKELEALLTPAISKAKEFLTAQQKEHPDLVREDPYLDTLVDIVGSSLGEAPASSEHESRCQEAQRRIDSTTPPGYKDDQKPVPERFGDVFIWFELIALGAAKKKPIVFITDDDKEDWWQIVGGEKLGPRPELRQEMRAKAGVDFYLYKPAYLLEAIGGKLPVKVAAASIDNAKQIAARLQLRSPGITVTGTGTVAGPPTTSRLGFRASDGVRLRSVARNAVALWLSVDHPTAAIVNQAPAPFDLMLHAADGSTAVAVSLLRDARHTSRVRYRDTSLRVDFELSRARVERALIVIVCLDEENALLMAEAVEEAGDDPAIPTSVGFLDEQQRYHEVLRRFEEPSD